ncbi:hypothetical protein B0H14DRAFT_2641205 [Mycena olivaceomarginata]|nr:hypothetical protein B0H14DRAFT_2641205 [Mycena olivaceomarginata]
MAKHKALYVEEDDLNDGSDSNDSQEGYLPRERGQHIHYIAVETITTGTHRVHSTMSSVPTPASPAKKSRITLKPEVPAAPAFRWTTGRRIMPSSTLSLVLACSQLDNPHGQWARLDREHFLDEVLRHDSEGLTPWTAGRGPELEDAHWSIPWPCSQSELSAEVSGNICPQSRQAGGKW